MQLTVQPNYYLKTIAYKNNSYKNYTPSIKTTNILSFKGNNDIFDYQAHLDKKLGEMNWIIKNIFGGKRRAKLATTLEAIDFRTGKCDERDINQNSRESELNDKDSQLNTKEKNLKLKDAEQRRKNNELQTRESEIVKKEGELSSEELRLDRKNSELTTREEVVVGKETSVKRKQYEAKQIWDEGIQMKEEAISIRESAINSKKDAIRIKEESLGIDEDRILGSFDSNKLQKESIKTLKESEELYQEEIIALKTQISTFKNNLEQIEFLKQLEAIEEQLVKKIGKQAKSDLRKTIGNLYLEFSSGNFKELGKLIIEIAKKI